MSQLFFLYKKKVLFQTGICYDFDMEIRVFIRNGDLK